MNKTVALLIERMEANPEEFYSSSHKWNWLQHSQLDDILLDEDKLALAEAYRKVRLTEFHAKVMDTILNPQKTEYVFSSSGTISNGLREAMRLDSSGNLSVGVKAAQSTWSYEQARKRTSI